MATKTMTRKTMPKAEQKSESTAMVKETTLAAETATSKKEKKVFEQSEGVMCHSVTQGGLFVEGPKTGMVYRFIDYGDEYEIEYRDLVALVRSKSSFVFHPYMIIDDEDFISEFSQIAKFYTEQYSVRDLRAILNEDVPTMIRKIKELPSDTVESLKNIAATQIKNGTIDSIRKVNALNDIFGAEFALDDGFPDEV